MCNRYNVVGPGDPGMAFRVGKQGLCWVSPAAETVPRTVFPGYLGHVIRLRGGEPGLDAMRFGIIPFWAPDPSDKRFRATNNARGETVHQLPTFREPFKRRRCLIPAASFNEWPVIGGKKTLHTVSRADGAPLLFAGIWDRWSREGVEVLSMAIITAEPHPDTRWLHHRMPVILEEADVERWMYPDADPEVLRSLLVGPGPEVIRAAKD